MELGANVYEHITAGNISDTCTLTTTIHNANRFVRYYTMDNLRRVADDIQYSPMLTDITLSNQQ